MNLVTALATVPDVPMHRTARAFGLMVFLAGCASLCSACAQPGGGESFSSDGEGPAAVFAARADRIVPRLIEERGIPGVAVVLVEDGAVVWASGYGLADVGARRPMTPETVVNVGSIAKSITAWAVMRLVEQGAVDLDAPISDYLTTWALPPSPFDERGVTVRRLLNHTAGTSQHGVDYVQLGEPVPSLEDALSTADGEGVRLVSPPGSAWRYSGGGTTLLQLMIETVTGRSYEAFVREHIFGPLGMRSSGFGWPPELLARAAQPYAGDGGPAAYQLLCAPARMNRLGKVTTILFGAFMLFMAVVFVLDAQSAREDPQAYEMVHDMSADAYARGGYWMAVLFGAGFVLSLLPFVDKKRAAYWQATVYIAGFALLVAMIYGFGQWAASGFDH